MQSGQDNNKVPEELAAKLQRDYLQINWNQSWKTTLLITKELPTKDIVAHKKIEKKTHDLLPVITRISFPYLQQLKLVQLALYSIQGIYQLSSPNLRALSLKNNLISNIRNLRKVNFPVLKTLNLSGNYISQQSCMSELHINEAGCQLVLNESIKAKLFMFRTSEPVKMTNRFATLMPLLKLSDRIEIKLDKRRDVYLKTEELKFSEMVKRRKVTVA